MKTLFKPKIRYDHLEWMLRGRQFHTIKIENDRLHSMTADMVDRAHPSKIDGPDTFWESFYLPLERRRLMAIPLSVHHYNSNFYVDIGNIGGFEVSKGNHPESKELKDILKETRRFLPFLSQEDLIRKIVPYDIKGGRIKGKHVLDRTMPSEEREAIESCYSKSKDLRLSRGICLEDYFNTAAICYRSAFNEKITNFSPREMYEKLADNRHGGMLDIKDPRSREEFSNWTKHSDFGAHPFEIVFSMMEQGIHLYPPFEEDRRYALSVSHVPLYGTYVDMLKGLVKENIPVRSEQLGEVLDYLSGECYFPVNNESGDIFSSLRYGHSNEERKRYFKHIEWDPIKIVRLKGGKEAQ